MKFHHPLLLTASICIASVTYINAASVVTGVPVSGFDEFGDPIASPPSDGQNVYDGSGALLGSWSVATGNSFTANQNQTNRNETSSISYNDVIKTNNTNNPDSHSASFTSFDASANASDFIVVDSESLDISVSWTYRDMRIQRRDMTDAAQAYDLTWTITDFVTEASDLGTQSGNETSSSVGVNQDFGFTGHVISAGVNTEIVPATFTGDTPNSILEYSGATAGELTGKYDGSNFELTLRADQERDTNATSWNETMNGDGDLIIGENPRGQLRVFFDADYDYTLTYTTFTFIAIPEPSSSLLCSLGLAGLLLHRRRL